MDKIKACECGNIARLRIGTVGGVIVDYRVGCNKCKNVGAISVSKEDAIKAWNTRKGEDV